MVVMYNKLFRKYYKSYKKKKLMTLRYNTRVFFFFLAHLAHSAGELLGWPICVLPDTQKLVRTTSHKLLVQFYPNFTGMISTKL
jgi:hypothetical protein